MVKAIVLLAASFFAVNAFAQNKIREEISLNEGWRTIANDQQDAVRGFEEAGFNDEDWLEVAVPHNWDSYEGYRRKRHGNHHGYAWYRRNFQVPPGKEGQRYFLFFEGVSSYATVWVNGEKVGSHAGGRTTFTLDITDLVKPDRQENTLAVRADHPAEIRDLPWVCGGCSDERGFSEGSEPMGIFRPVNLLVTDPVRIEPFGVHIWNDSTISEKAARLYINTEVKNYGDKTRTISLQSRLLDRQGATVLEVKEKKKIRPGQVEIIQQQSPQISDPHLWSLDDPYLYTLVSEVIENGKIIDRIETPYGIRWISWPIRRADGDNRFFLNGEPVFINGVAEYEHQLGGSHAFSAEQIRTRVMQMKAAGFNAFRAAHQPHNLRYQQHWDSLGFLNWTQLSAHVWFDTPEFKENFKTRLKEWVKERRNSPSVVLWGIQNESRLSPEFERECTELIRQLDPTASSQRLVTTCNGGTGTDWDVPQNWSGTYGGDPEAYGEDLQRQILVGEYGAWRTLDLHTSGPFDQNGVYSEDRMTQLMETKVRLAESVKDKVSGHFFWLFTTHDNPGRVQAGEGYRELDRIGPANYKGLLTLWEEPLDVFYMYRSNYAPKETEPMVYIASHTWPDRWLTTGQKDSIKVYSNCDEVELFNDVKTRSLGRKSRGGKGTHFRWDDVDIQYNVLYAVGYVNGEEVASDYIVLNHLPEAPNFSEFLEEAGSVFGGTASLSEGSSATTATETAPVTAGDPAYHYLYRVNCGGPDYVDQQGNIWMADRAKLDEQSWGSKSWTNDFPEMPAFFASQRRTHDPIKGTADWELFQHFRYGREKLSYEFPVPDGEYLVELYFTEPWLGTGGGLDCSGWRLFDVAVNGQTLIEDLDIWTEVGHDVALKKVLKARVRGGKLELSFPKIKSGQALISGIAIATTDQQVKAAPGPAPLIRDLKVEDQAQAEQWSVHSWLDTGYKQYSDEDAAFSALPPDLFGAEWIRVPQSAAVSEAPYLAELKVSTEADVYVAIDERITETPAWLADYVNTGTYVQSSRNGGHNYLVYHQMVPKGSSVRLGENGKTDNGPAAMYTVAVQKSSRMDPPYDLKPSTSYKAFQANLIGSGIVEDEMNGMETAKFVRASGDTLEWTITVGVADIYALEIKYHNPLEKQLSARVELLANDGTLMKEDTLEATYTKPGKWNYYNSTTGSMINAGDYKVRLISEDAKELSIRDISVR